MNALLNSFLSYVLSRFVEWHGVKVGPEPEDPGLRDPGTQDLGPPSKFKSGTWDPPKV